MCVRVCVCVCVFLSSMATHKSALSLAYWELQQQQQQQQPARQAGRTAYLGQTAQLALRADWQKKTKTK